MDDTTRPVIYTSTEDFLVRFLHQIGPFVSAITTVPGHDVQAIEEELRDAVNPARDDPDPCIQLAVVFSSAHITSRRSIRSQTSEGIK